MGVKERQDREREAVRHAILTAARDLFLAEGYRNVSIRKIAERIEYSPAAIYGYFASKDDIFFALAEEGFHLLFEDGALVDESTDPVETVRRLFWRFYTFSKDHPEYFALMFVERAVPRISRDWERFAFVREMRVKVQARIRACIDAGVFPASATPEAIFRILSTAIYGAAVFRLSDRLAPGEDADALARDTLDAVIAGLCSGLRLTFTSSCDTREPLPDARVSSHASGVAGSSYSEG